jgi:hypothetical protein
MQDIEEQQKPPTYFFLSKDLKAATTFHSIKLVVSLSLY